MRIRWASLVKRTNAAGSIAARLRVVSKCAFTRARNKKEGIQVNPEHPRICFLLPVYHRPSSLCHLPQMSRSHMYLVAETTLYIVTLKNCYGQSIQKIWKYKTSNY